MSYNNHQLNIRIQRLSEIHQILYYWTQYASTTLAVALLIYLNFHYINGGCIAIISVLILIVQLIISLIKERYLLHDEYYYKLLEISIFIIRLLIAIQAGLFIWTIVLIFTHTGTTAPPI